MKKIIAVVLTTLMLAVGLSACNEDDADVVNHNISKASQNFEVYRRVALVNGITDKYILSVEGLCDIDPKSDRIFVTCKISKGEGADSYLRHQFYKSDNTFLFVEQLEGIKVSAYHYRITFKPQTLVPDVDFRGSTDELPSEQ